ncbi:MAG: DNA-directed RNA polymerase subunit omega [Vicingaceae bacterium]|jgi:DNA-directed RNA polymerase subunit K/omega|nr:DNA-directed RNA polymerase subunit omega [Flavobacteriales bacterium]MBQ21083.1 RNA polymerase Rpb6 [Flavobacteriales bacterium]MDF1676556.1 DNA-directed RNA polymerase subunit omega [Vicingaceae bacterium]|tara:strand:- start:98063 stop:98389 length:327 start_codon:yes stop_codon:yes gene_type:complete
MNFKTTNAETSTITRDLQAIEDVTGNIYESVVAVAKRSNQIAVDLKEELVNKIQEFASTTDNLEEVFENREQIEISRFYERLPKTNAMALKEFLDEKIFVKNPDVDKA